MGALNLFISHSSKTPDHKSLLDQVSSSIDQLENGKKFNVLVDNRIEPGSEWFSEINEWMMECHVAVILLSEAALKSEWVKAESAVLCARRRSNLNFPLLLIPLGDVDADGLNEHPFFKVIRISDFQTIRDCQDDNEIITKLCQQLNNLQSPDNIENTPFGHMMTLVQEILNQLDHQTVARALQQTDTNQNLADYFIRKLLRDPQNIFPCLLDLIEKLAHVISEHQANQLLKIVKGHWVDSGAGASLNISISEQKTLAINGYEVDNFTGHSYASKAWPFPQEYTLIPVGSDRTFCKIEDTLLNSKLAKSATSLRRRKLRIQTYENPLLLVFPYPDVHNNMLAQFPDPGLIEEILTNYKNVTIVVAIGLEDHENLEYIQTLNPPLQEDQEDEQCKGYENVKYYINQYIANPTQ